MQRDTIDKRRYVRVAFPFTIHVMVPETLAISAYTEDISEGGVKVTIKEKLEVGLTIGLEIFVKEDPIRCRGSVVWVKQRESDLIEGEVFFDVGIELQDLSPQDSLVIKHHVEAVQKIK
jgi:Tfp pilus assembly protein PilZ